MYELQYWMGGIDPGSDEARCGALVVNDPGNPTNDPREVIAMTLAHGVRLMRQHGPGELVVIDLQAQAERGRNARVSMDRIYALAVRETDPATAAEQLLATV
jgi:hypothetical protein